MKLKQFSSTRPHIVYGKKNFNYEVDSNYFEPKHNNVKAISNKSI